MKQDIKGFDMNKGRFNMKIGTKLGVAFAAVLTLAAALTMIGAWRLYAVDAAADEMATASQRERSIIMK